MKFSRLIFANLFRKKVRLILTIGSFAIALVLFTFLAVVKSAFSRGTEIAGADRLIVVSRIGLMQLLPISDRDKIMAIPGVKAVTHNHWFGITGSAVSIRMKRTSFHSLSSILKINAR